MLRRFKNLFIDPADVQAVVIRDVEASMVTLKDHQTLSVDEESAQALADFLEKGAAENPSE